VMCTDRFCVDSVMEVCPLSMSYVLIRWWGGRGNESEQGDLLPWTFETYVGVL
jgi:hypothetical protein